MDHLMEYEGLSAEIAGYIDKKRRGKEETIEKSLEKALKDEPEEGRRAAIGTEYQAELQAINKKYNYINWLSNASNRAKEISLVTHAPKYTHGRAKGSGVLDVRSSTDPQVYFSTLTLSQLEMDFICNAADMDVAKLLQLSFEGTSVADCLVQDDSSPFAPFTGDPQLLNEWITGFKLALVDNAPSSHTFSKQIFFPIADQQYHLLSPLFPSSLAHEVYERIEQSRFGELAKEIREARRAGKYDAAPDVSYPNTVLQFFGGSNEQNISALNKTRGGKMWLLSCAPPNWQSRLKPPSGKNIFDSREFNRRAWRQVNELKTYLLSVVGKDSTLEIRQTRGRHVLALVDTLLNYATEIQSLTDRAGWSSAADCHLDDAQKLWLELNNPDAEFQQRREADSWSVTIGKQFASWLNNHLKHEKMTFAQ
ncbi:type I-F CRISPR-associated protein Csy1, partial [Edaphovirga cremea]|uniref:type I-F CRISPR-associated protein Csy1 n=1 Tax=Edaphovirga cremea TaxID=2267246 RepID=UPI0039894554